MNGLKMALCAGSFGLAAFAAQTQEAKTIWELGKDSIDQAALKGEVKLVDGLMRLDTTNSFSIPASVLGGRKDYTIEFEIKRAAAFKNLPRMEGALCIVSNRDVKAHAGFSLIYLPPAWDLNGGVSNKIGIDVNAYWNGECGGLDGDGFNKYSIVVKGGCAAIYRNGLLLAMTGEINPSQLPLSIGGKGWRGESGLGEGEGKPVPEPYELRNLKIYDGALAPTGYDRSVEVMRNCSGEGYSMQRADIKDPSLPRILVIGDSISMGYRGFITKHFKDKAYVDYWVGGSWFDPSNVKGEDSPVKRSFKNVLANGPYDVVSWNSMTLHMWGPNHPDRCPLDTCAENMESVVEYLKRIAPSAKFIWVRCTPITIPVEGGPSVIDERKSDGLVKRNAIVDGIVGRYGIPEVDLYALCGKNLDKASKDGVHWEASASTLMADEICKEIEKALQGKLK